MNKDNNVSEYKIGRTTYIVKLVFNPASKERLTDILQRLIDRECEEMPRRAAPFTSPGDR